MKVTYALYEVLHFLVEACPDFFEASTITIDVGDFTLKLRWIHTGENSEVGRMAKPDAGEHVCLSQWHFVKLWATLGT